MAVDPATPEPLRTALENMEAAVRSTMNGLPFAAPEMHPLLWGTLHERLAESITTLYDDLQPWKTTPRELTRLYQHVARELKRSGEVAGEGFILRLAEITVDATLEALAIEVSQ